MRGIQNWLTVAWVAVPQRLAPRGFWAWLGGAALALCVAAGVSAAVGGARHHFAKTPSVAYGATGSAPGGGGSARLATGVAAGAPALRPNAVLPKSSVPMPAAGAVAGTVAGTAAPSTGLGDAVVRRVEESASMTVRVKDVGEAFDALTAMAGGLGGYVQSSSLQTGGGDPGSGVTQAASASVVVAVPHEQYATFIKQAGGLGKVLTTSANGQDVTQQYVDLQGRITALKAERQSYLTLMSKATAIGDILQIQSALTDVQSQIENLTGQLHVLDSLSAMATVAVSLVAPVAVVTPPPPQRPGPVQRVTAAFSGSVQALANGATALALALAWMLPWAVLVLVGLLVFRRLSRRGARV